MTAAALPWSNGETSITADARTPVRNRRDFVPLEEAPIGTPGAEAHELRTGGAATLTGVATHAATVTRTYTAALAATATDRTEPLAWTLFPDLEG